MASWGAVRKGKELRRHLASLELWSAPCQGKEPRRLLLGLDVLCSKFLPNQAIGPGQLGTLHLWSPR